MARPLVDFSGSTDTHDVLEQDGSTNNSGGLRRSASDRPRAVFAIGGVFHLLQLTSYVLLKRHVGDQQVDRRKPPDGSVHRLFKHVVRSGSHS